MRSIELEVTKVDIKEYLSKHQGDEGIKNLDISGICHILIPAL